MIFTIYGTLEFMKPMKTIFQIVCFMVLINSLGCNTAEKQTAQWITHPEFQHESNQWYQLRTNFKLKEIPEKAVAKIAADSKYWLYINGELAIFEGQLKRGPNANDTYFDEVDLSKWMKKGENTIAVQLWYFGREGFSHKDSKKAGFFFDCSADNRRIVSDSTWTINIDPAFYGTDDPQGNYRLPESNVRYVAAKAITGWQLPGFDDTKWQHATNSGAEGVAPWNTLVRRPIPLFKTFPLQQIKNYGHEGNKIKLKLPYNMQYHPYLKVKAQAGKMIRINPDNLKELNDTPLRAEYITRDGVQEYLHLPWLSGHEIHMELEDGIEVLELGYMESGYDTQFDGTFEVSDEYLMRYFKKAQRTLYVNMRDTYFDCPDRERAQWIGDGTILMEEAFYLLDNQALDLSKKMYNELFDWQREDKTMYAPVPAGNWDKELPQQILAAVGNYGIGRYFMYSGDKDMLKKAYPHIKRYLELWKVAEDGSVPFRRGGWTWGDWGSQIDRELAEHIWVYIALDNLQNMASALGKHEEATQTRDKMAAIKRFINEKFWTKSGYRSTGFKEETDDRGNALAVISGIADEEKYPVIIDLFKKVEHASPYMEKYVMEALFKMGEGKFGIDRFKRRYEKMVNHPTCTTLWELWNYGASVNHAWSGGPLSILYKKLAGIEPLKPGFEEFSVYPDLIGLEDLKCSFSTVKGNISLDIKVKADKTAMKLEVPENSVAVVRIPVATDKLEISPASELKELKRDDNYKYYPIRSGEWMLRY